MLINIDFAVIIPLANEGKDFQPLISLLSETLDFLESGKVYLVVDNASKDDTKKLCEELQEKDERFELVWSPENKNVVDAYLKGYRVAHEKGHELMIEMDGGLSHDPRALPMFLRVLTEGNDCAFGSRFINGGSIQDSNIKRHILSKGGTFLSNFLLSTGFKDMTSGYQGFHRSVVGKFLDYSLLSRGHFYQTELRYLLRKNRVAEVPIHYRAPSSSVSSKSIFNSFRVLFYYFFRRLLWRSVVLKNASNSDVRSYRISS